MAEPGTIAVPLELAQATFRILGELPSRVSEESRLMWRQVFHAHEQQVLAAQAAAAPPAVTPADAPPPPASPAEATAAPPAYANGKPRASRRNGAAPA